MRHLSIDIETFSDVDIRDVGLFRYVDSPHFNILLLSYSYDFSDSITTVDLTTGKLTHEFIRDLESPEVVKHAYNAAFEIECLKAYGLNIKEDQWECTQLKALYAGYPRALDDVATALGLENKNPAGHYLINYFTKPCKSTKMNGGRLRNLPIHDPDKWSEFKSYNRQDVKVEMAVYNALIGLEVPNKIREQWLENIRINETGIRVDENLVSSAVDLDKKEVELAVNRLRNLTGLSNPNSLPQLKEWLATNGVPVEQLTKEVIDSLIDDGTCNREVVTVLKLKRKIASTSVSKFNKMQECVCHDGRIKGVMRFYGANKTGRWASELVQLQNMPQNHLESIELARDYLKNQDKEMAELTYGRSLHSMLPELIRTALIPSEGMRFAIADYSAIEARITAWVANEEWQMEVFKGDGKIYEATAAKMFNVPIETIVKGHPNYALRAKGKVASLALGYQGGLGAMKAMGADKMGLDDTEILKLVKLWRFNNQNIVKSWKELEKAVEFVSRNRSGAYALYGAVVINYCNQIKGVEIKLPSGRVLYYPGLEVDQQGISYLTTDQKSRKWARVNIYGGMLFENIVQGIARDCLAEFITRLKSEGMRVVFHVHDEVIAESEDSEKDLNRMLEIMSEPIEWAKGLVLKGAGFTSDFYRKD